MNVAIVYLQKYLLYILAGLLTFILPIQESLLFVGVISMLDFCSGIMRAQKIGTLQSRKMIKKFYTVISYFIGIVIAHYVQVFFQSDAPIVKAVVAIICVTEIQSVRENIKVVTGKDILKPIFDVLHVKGNSEKPTD